MYPALDPPPVAAQPTVAAPATAPDANTTLAQLAAHNYPPYAEMISAAISALKERDGSSKSAIAKYIETHYSDLPPTHSALLTYHLKRLKSNGELLMVKHSYKLPGSTPAAVNGAVNAVSADPSSTVPKRSPGRPSKLKLDAVQAAVPVFPTPVNINAEPIVVPEATPPGNVAAAPGTAYIAVGPVNGAVASVPVRGRGRPPKQGGVRVGSGHPPKSGGPYASGGVGRGRGRPRKNVAAAPAAAREKGLGRPRGRPRGRPPKPINVVEGLASVAPVGVGLVAAPDIAIGVGPPVVAGGVSPVGGKRRGRPPKVSGEEKTRRNMNALQLRKRRKLSGKPLGRPRKDSAAVNRTPVIGILVSYLDLKAKLENLQSVIKQTAMLIRPSLKSEAAMNALQELELVAMNAANAPPNAQSEQPATPPQHPQPPDLQTEVHFSAY